jgi:hypothetical protein
MGGIWRDECGYKPHKQMDMTMGICPERIMDAKKQIRAVHSADVRMFLRLDGQLLPIVQLGPDFFVLREPIDHPPAEAEIGMWIDGEETRWPLHMRDGLTTASRKSRIARYSLLRSPQ